MQRATAVNEQVTGCMVMLQVNLIRSNESVFHRKPTVSRQLSVSSLADARPTYEGLHAKKWSARFRKIPPRKVKDAMVNVITRMCTISGRLSNLRGVLCINLSIFPLSFQLQKIMSLLTLQICTMYVIVLYIVCITIERVIQ
jgi:hypothetical protein